MHSFKVINPLGYEILNELKQSMCRNQRKGFQPLELLQQRTENVWPPVSQNNI
jgi:hypothetical protein